jgi:hypothetical protein
MGRIDDEQPTAQPSSLPSTDPIRPGYEVLTPNLSTVSAATFRRGSLSRRRVNIALGLLLTVAIVTAILILFADFIFANLGTVLGVGLLVIMAIGTIGLGLIRRDEQRARRVARYDDV